MPKKRARKIPPGFKLRHTLRGHIGIIHRIAWSPDGRTLASAGGHDETVKLWDAESGRLLRSLEGHSSTVFVVAWSPDGRTLASGGNDNTVKLWDAESWHLLHSLEMHSSVHSIAWSPDGRTLASATETGVVIWDAESGQLPRSPEDHFAPVLGLAWSPNGQTLITAHYETIKIFDIETMEPRRVLEGHTNYVMWLSLSSDGKFIASVSWDDTVRLWHYETGGILAVLNVRHADESNWQGLSFHPTAAVLATLGDKDTVICIWELDFDILLSSPAIARSTSYTNAKVVLVGDSGVGKTGLGLRLAERDWRPTESTHGMNVWTLHSEPGREVMLWDFAGQDEYRLVHQLFLNETNVALLLYDPTKSDDTFEGIEFWEKALKNAVSGDVQKILVAARTDVGGVRMTKGDIENYLKANGYLAHFPTSAEKDEGCDDLRAAIMEAIPWDRLPRTSSPEVFKRIKDFLGDVRQGNRILVRESDLRAEFNRQAGDKEAPTEAEFRTVIGHVETAGLIKRLSFGDFVLLKPELLNGYASDIVDAARRHPAGLGAVSKADVLDGRIRLKDEGGLSAADKIFMLHATVELFLRLGLALEQDGNLVFPSKFNRRMPPLAEDPVVEVEFSFEGPVENLYTTLVVKLYYGGVFRLKQLWKNAAEFLDGRGLVCGFQLLSRGDGQGTLKVFYAEGVSDNDKALFLKIVDDHFREKRVEVRRERLYRCPHCREPVRDRNAIHHALKQDVRDMPCLYCFKPFPLIDALEMLYRDDEKFLSQIAMMETNAEAGMVRGGGLVAAAAEVKTDDFKRWAGDVDLATVAVVFTDVLGSTTLNVEIGDERWRQVRESHFARARSLIKDGHGYLIKTIGDSIMAAFHSGSDALDFALALQHDTGSEVVKIRVGINVGTVEITSGDAFGQQVSMAARVEAKAQKGGIWVSDKVKEEVDTVRAERHQHLNWKRHPNKKIKGFTKRFTLWSVEEQAAE